MTDNPQLDGWEMLALVAALGHVINTTVDGEILNHASAQALLDRIHNARTATLFPFKPAEEKS